MSHELRTPLNGVVGMLNLLLRGRLTAKDAAYARKAHISSDALLNVIGNILDLSKIEAGKLELERVEFDIRTTVDEVMQMMSAQAERKGLSFTAVVDDAVPACFMGDPGRIKQILLNLASNAIKFTPSGRVAISVTVTKKLDARATVLCSVRDTGVGIETHRKASLFESFSQADISTTRSYGGAGLALSISRQLSDLMDGDLSVESKPGVASTFTFRIALEIGTPGFRVPTQAPTDLDSPHFDRPACILIPEDNEINREVTGEMVKAFGFTCECVTNGAEAVTAALPGRFDLVLMDCQMPELDGYAATRTIRDGLMSKRHDGTNPNYLPIVALTAHAMEGDREQCIRAGMDDFLTKPVGPDTLHRVIQRWLRKAAGLSRPAEEAAAVFAETSLRSI